MVKITKVYTKKGDKGKTQLAGAKRATKTSPRVQALGDIDELNSFLGLIIPQLTTDKNFSDLHNKILRIQNTLFDLGAQLAVPPKKRRPDTPKLQENDAKTLENEIDAMNAELTPLKSFILPGENEISARLHLARVVCRRTERSLAKLNEEEKLDGTEIPFLNRLSDWLFVAARFVNFKLGGKELLWEPGKRNY